MIRIREAILVEGRHDKARLANVVDTLVLTTEGFGVFNDREKILLLNRVANERGLVIFTDSDSAGFFIRNRLKGMINGAKHAFIPQIPGKERRKTEKSKSGLLGVEGMTDEVLEKALLNSGVELLDANNVLPDKRSVTKLDFYNSGLIGAENSSEKRGKLLKKLELPHSMTTNLLIAAMNVVCPDPEGFLREFIAEYDI